MKLDNVFKKTRTINVDENEEKIEIPDGLMRKCPKCGGMILTKEIREHKYVCPKCGGYFRIGAKTRLKMIVDKNTFEEWNHGTIEPASLAFPGYEEKWRAAQEKTGLDDAVLTGAAMINGERAAIAICDGRFMMASMGSVVGEKITRMVERATKEKLPVVIFACSGGARMQEGMHSLMQMTKTSAALKKHSEAGLLYISVLTDPTTGGVTASYAMLGDIILAEPKALVGFAGRRVIEQTIGEKLPADFQRAEFLLEHGFLDATVEREKMKDTLSTLLKMHQTTKNKTTEVDENKDKFIFTEEEKKHRIRSAWEHVTASRRKGRPVGADYIDALFTDFFEMHGDRYFGDDKAVVGGIAYFNGEPVTVIAQHKGKGTKENIEHNFGMPQPEGYRKALRLMKQAEKFHRPVICFVDTPGAFCGVEAEERGQGEAIARNLYEMSALKTPILSLVIGEGGSGGALAMATSNEVWMLENAVYSILSPEGFASILWKDSSRAQEASENMKMTSYDLLESGIIEKIIAEPDDYCEKNFSLVTKQLEEGFKTFLEKYKDMTEEEIAAQRYERFRKL